ncbi:MAG: Lrp/AsnC family transcriptional regulator [bacterium]
MNAIDQNILKLLLKDARTPHAHIADEVGLSRPAVAERVKKLETSGIIKGYSAVLDPASLGKHITAFVSAKLPGILETEIEQALKNLENNPEILEIHSIAGEDCFLIKVRTDDMKSLNKIVLLLKSPPLTMTTKTTIVLESYFEKVGGATLK